MTRQDKYMRDMSIEAMAAKFLDENFYAMFDGKAKVTRHTDTYHQFGGIDVTVNNTHFDEKLKVRGCLNQVQQYVGFECQFRNRAQNIQNGWFMDDSLSTDYYAIVGLSATVEGDVQISSESQISAADVLWVKKQDLKDFIFSKTPEQQLANDIEDLRRRGDILEGNREYGSDAEAFVLAAMGQSKSRDGKYRERYQHGCFWLTYSPTMPEQPLNLVVPRHTLESLPSAKHFRVYRDKAVKLVKEGK